MGSLTNSEIPIVDCAIISDGEYSLSLKDSPEFKEFATSLGNGFCQMGLVYFINHGIEESIVSKLQISYTKIIIQKILSKFRYKIYLFKIN